MDYFTFRQFHTKILCFIRDVSDFCNFTRQLPLSETQCVLMIGYCKKSIDGLQNLKGSLEVRLEALRNEKKVIKERF